MKKTIAVFLILVVILLTGCNEKPLAKIQSDPIEIDMAEEFDPYSVFYEIQDGTDITYEIDEENSTVSFLVSKGDRKEEYKDIKVTLIYPEEILDAFPYTLNDEEKKELLGKYRGYWRGEVLPVSKEEQSNPFEQALIKIYTDEDAPFIPISELGDEYDVPDFMDGFMATYYGMFFRTNRVSQINENTYVFEDVEYIFPDEGYIDSSGKEWLVTSITISDPDTNDDSIILSITYNQDSSIADYLSSGMEFKRWNP